MLCARNAGELEVQRGRLADALSPHRGGCGIRRRRKTSAMSMLLFRGQPSIRSVDILVNNAGIYGPMGSIDPSTGMIGWTRSRST